MDHEDVKPDILILGKALSGGVLPVSNFLKNHIDSRAATTEFCKHLLEVLKMKLTCLLETSILNTF